MMIDMVTATINVNVELKVHSNTPKSKNLDANRGYTTVPGSIPSYMSQIIGCICALLL